MKPGPKPTVKMQISLPLASKRAPNGLSEGAQKYWRQEIHPLIEGGAITVVDVSLCVELCETLAIAEAARQELLADGATTAGYRGQLKKNPAWQVYRDAMRLAMSIKQQIGATPSSRQKLIVAKEEDEPSLAQQLVALVQGSSDSD